MLLIRRNHAPALALAAKMLGTKATIIMRTIPQRKKNAVAGYGADIILCDTLESRESTLQEFVNKGGTF
jgi:threonine dehydratase